MEPESKGQHARGSVREPRIRGRRVVSIAFATVGIGYLALCLGACAVARSLTFPAPHARVWPKYAEAPLRIASPAGDVLAWYVPAPAGAPTLLYFHGNGEQLADAIPFGSWLREQGLGLLAVEYPGYAGAPGAPSEATILTAARTATAYLRDTLHVPRERTVLLGRSLGTGVAAALAADGLGAKLILLSPYTSIPDVGARAFPFLPVHLLAPDRFDTLSLAPRITVPTLVMHGTADEVIPVELGREVAHAIAGARYVELPGVGHNDLPERADVLSAIAEFATP
jgi:pimeloyl-ACP methyl ester carboxylesterase